MRSSHCSVSYTPPRVHLRYTQSASTVRDGGVGRRKAPPPGPPYLCWAMARPDQGAWALLVFLAAAVVRRRRQAIFHRPLLQGTAPSVALVRDDNDDDVVNKQKNDGSSDECIAAGTWGGGLFWCRDTTITGRRTLMTAGKDRILTAWPAGRPGCPVLAVLVVVAAAAAASVVPDGNIRTLNNGVVAARTESASQHLGSDCCARVSKSHTIKKK